VEVKYIPNSRKLYRVGYHSVAVLSDGETYEKILIFGGIALEPGKKESCLSNQLSLIEIKQIM
jgi:hypothetical protein